MDAFWIATAYVSGLGAKALRLPTLVGYLAAGLLLSAFGMTNTDLLVQIGDLGVIFLLFTVGLHLRLKNVIRPEVLGVGGIHLLISAILFTGLGLAFGLNLTAALLVAIGLGFSSTVLTAKSLEARKELDAYHGRIAIGILILQDIVAVALLAFTGTATPNLGVILLLALPLLRPLLVRLLVLSGREEVMLLFGLLMALGMGAAFELAGLSSKLGALIGGMLLAGHERGDELYEKLWGLKEVFLVGFFLQVGLAGFPSVDGLLIVLVLLVLLPLKAVLFFSLLLSFRLRARTAFMTSISLTAYSEFALIVGTAAATAGLVSAEMVVVLALLVATSYGLNAPLSRAANSLWARYEPFLARFERDIPHPDDQPHSLGQASFLVVGMGQVGTAAYDRIAAQGERPLGLDSDPGQIAKQLKAGRRVIFGDAQDPELWAGLDLKGLQAVVLAVPNTRAKIRATRALRQHGFLGTISALIRQEEPENDLLEAGVSSVCLPLTQAGYELADLSLQKRNEAWDAPRTFRLNLGRPGDGGGALQPQP